MIIPFSKSYLMKSKLLALLNKVLSHDVLIIVVGCVLFLLVEIPILTDGRPIMADEAWYSNPAYNFSQGNGLINTNVGSGGNLNFIFPVIQGILFTIFGYSIFMARFASVLAGLFSILVLFKLLKHLKVPNRAIIFSLFALIAIPVYHSVFRYARPESWAILFVLLSLFFFIKHMQNPSNIHILLTGFFCGLGFLTHPFTLSISFAMGLILIYQFLMKKKILPLVAFSIPLIVFYAIFHLNSIYLIGYTKPYRGFRRINTLDTHYWDRIGLNLKVIFNSYIMDKNVIYFIPMILLLLLGLFLKKNNRLAFQSSLLGCLVFGISLAFFSSGGFEMIFYYVFIFSILNIAFLVNAITGKSILVAFSAYFTLMLLANIYYDMKKYEPVNSLLERKLQTIIPEKATVMGPTEFWMFVPKTQFKSTGFRWRGKFDIKQLPSKIDYFLMFSKDKSNIHKKYFDIACAIMEYPGSKLVYASDSKNYGKIELYSIKDQNDPIQ